MTYETQSAKAVIAKVYRDLQTQDQSWEIDAIEWIGEAMEKIGAAPLYEQREEVYAVESHQLAMPTGVMQIRGLWLVKGIDYTINTDSIDYDTEALKDAQKQRIPRKQGSGRRLRKGLGVDGTQDQHYSNTQKFYTLNPGTIHTSFEDELVILGYKGIATDDEGYPVIPKSAHSDEAFFWYIMYKLLTRNPSIHPQMDWRVAQQEWEKHKHRAKSKLKMPDPDEYEHFQQTWVHMIQPKHPTREQHLIGGGTYQGGDLIDSPIQ